MVCSDKTKILQCEHLGISIDHARLLDNISFSLCASEVLAIIGPNGAGKSTLLKTIVGDFKKFDGSITFCNRDLHQWPLQQKALHMAVLPQLSLLNFPYVVDEVVALGRAPHSSGARVDNQVVEDVMEAMDIGYLKGRLYTQLSGGEKQRTQLARVLAQIWRSEDAEGRLLLLDEPSTALDLGHQQQLMAAVKRFAENGAAVLMVLHDVNLAARHADSILALSCGRTMSLGKSNEVLTIDLLQQLYHAEVHVLDHPSGDGKIIVS